MMASSKSEIIGNNSEGIQQWIQSLPKGESWSHDRISKYDYIWYPTSLLKFMITFQRNFEARDTDIILASAPKSGTTWIKALMYTIINRGDYRLDTNPLHDTNPHLLVPCLEFDLYVRSENPDLDSIASPRLFSTHVHYDALPDSITRSKSKIVYLCRNPLDRLISHWNFVCRNEFAGQPLPIEEAFECFIEGKDTYGPIWDHMLGYWKASLENPEKILFMKYEDLKEDTITCLKKLAEFLGCGFEDEEENKGLIEDIKKLCSIQSLSNMEVNKTGEIVTVYKFKNSSFFRKGEIGDWVNYLNPSMAERFEKVMKEKLEGTGLSFEPYCNWREAGSPAVNAAGCDPK